MSLEQTVTYVPVRSFLHHEPRVTRFALTLGYNWVALPGQRKIEHERGGAKCANGAIYTSLGRKPQAYGD